MGKPDRKLMAAGQAQQAIEQSTKDKFAEVESIAISQPKQEKAPSSNGRVSPQLSCTVSPEDRQLLNELSVYAVTREGKVINTSSIIRALIRLGHKRRDELEF